MPKKLDLEKLLDLEPLDDDVDAEAITERLQALGALKDAVRERQRELTAQRDELAATDRAAQLVETLSDAEKAALVQHLGLQGIPSSARVGRER